MSKKLSEKQKPTLKQTVAKEKKAQKAWELRDAISRITVTRIAPPLVAIFVVWYLLTRTTIGKALVNDLLTIKPFYTSFGDMSVLPNLNLNHFRKI